jgi:sugar phosphate isomerase/epimerase
VASIFDRREFLAWTAGACGIAATANRGRAAGGMYVSLNGSLTRQMDWKEFAALASRVGYGGVDVNLSGARAQGVEATRALFSSLNLKPSVTNLPVQVGSVEDTYQAALTSLGDAATFAASVGCQRMMAVLPPSSQRPKAEQRKIVKDRVTAISEVLSTSSIRLGLEFLGPKYFRTRGPHEFIWRMDETVELAADCGSNVGVVLDAWHWHHAGGTVNDILAAGKSRIVHVHVSDARPQEPDDVRDNQRLMPGEGVIDLVGFFRALAKIGYADAVSPEPLGRIPAEMPAEEAARLGLDTTLAVMKKAGVEPQAPSRGDLWYAPRHEDADIS